MTAAMMCCESEHGIEGNGTPRARTTHLIQVVDHRVEGVEDELIGDQVRGPPAVDCLTIATLWARSM